MRSVRRWEASCTHCYCELDIKMISRTSSAVCQLATASHWPYWPLSHWPLYWRRANSRGIIWSHLTLDTHLTWHWLDLSPPLIQLDTDTHLTCHWHRSDTTLTLDMTPTLIWLSHMNSSRLSAWLTTTAPHCRPHRSQPSQPAQLSHVLSATQLPFCPVPVPAKTDFRERQSD